MSVDEALPTITSQPGTVGSRFVSQNDIDAAKARREEQWKAAYARIGQEPPPQPTEDVYDGRSLAEKLAANKIAKQEEWEEKTKLANQFRALEEDEVQFLESIRDEEQRKELKRKHEDAEEVKGFKEAVAARNALPASASPPGTSTAPPPPSKQQKSSQGNPTKKSSNAKNALKGVVVKKKPSKPTPPESIALSKAKTASTKPDDSKTEKSSERDEAGVNKKQKLASPP